MKAIVDRFLEGALAAILGGMVLVVSWQVLTRFLLRQPSSITEELVRFGLVWLALLGASYGFGQRAHLAIDLLPRGPKLEFVVHAAVAVFASVVLVFGGWRLVDITLTLGQSSAALQVERGYVYVVLPLSGLLILFYTVIDFRERVR